MCGAIPPMPHILSCRASGGLCLLCAVRELILENWPTTSELETLGTGTNNIQKKDAFRHTGVTFTYIYHSPATQRATNITLTFSCFFFVQ
jgi:hypothetical protein